MKSKKSNESSNTAPAVGLQQTHNTGKKPGGCTGKGFRPGKSGNPSGKRRGEVSLTAWIKRSLSQGRKLEQLGEAIFASALKGDVQAQKLLWDRIDGRVKEEISGHFTGNFVGPVAGPAEVVILLPDNNRGASYPSPSEIAGT